PSLRALVDGLATPSRSRPTQCDSHSASPAGRAVPETLLPHSPTSAPDPPCDTAACPALGYTDAARSAPLSAPPHSNTRALLPTRRYRFLPSLPPALNSFVCRVDRFPCS